MKSFFTAVLLYTCLATSAQNEDLLQSLPADSLRTEKVTNAFKSTRVIMSHSLKMLNEGVLDFRILHRFGLINGGLSEFFGLDGPANVRLGLDYGISQKLTVGAGRTTYKKELDGFVKWQLMQQSAGRVTTPFTVIAVAGSTVRTDRWADGRSHTFSDRVAYYAQLIAGRKFSEVFSLQIAPTIVHTNYVETTTDRRTLYATGIGSRIRLSARTSLTMDYYLVSSKEGAQLTTNPLSIGFDIETGGHVFQLHFTNAHTMNERAFITETINSWGDGEIMFGFNISRVFQLKKSN